MNWVVGILLIVLGAIIIQEQRHWLHVVAGAIFILAGALFILPSVFR